MKHSGEHGLACRERFTHSSSAKGARVASAGLAATIGRSDRSSACLASPRMNGCQWPGLGVALAATSALRSVSMNRAEGGPRSSRHTSPSFTSARGDAGYSDTSSETETCKRKAGEVSSSRQDGSSRARRAGKARLCDAGRRTGNVGGEGLAIARRIARVRGESQRRLKNTQQQRSKRKNESGEPELDTIGGRQASVRAD